MENDIEKTEYKYYVEFSLSTRANSAVSSATLNLDRTINNESDLDYLRAELIKWLGYPIPNYLTPGHLLHIISWHLLEN